MEHFDVIIVGAGLSGIGAAKHLQDHCPGKRYTILESRTAMGGTWDLFRYPGIRSDSDMHTLGYNFKPWIDDKAIAEGPSIRSYIEDTATENNILPHIRYQQRLEHASWSSADSSWTLTTRNPDTGETSQLSCNFLFMCSGYYSYKQGFTPEFAGRDDFNGTIVHPQHWPEDLDYTGKRVVVIGSGATAVTLVPAMLEGGAAHVTMLQRTPTYMASKPWRDSIANVLRAILPNSWAYAITRWKNTMLQQWVYNKSRNNPESLKKMIMKRVRKAVGPDFDVDTHLTPPYNPWDQRLCLVPDNDFFNVLRDGTADIVTDHIDRFTEKGIALTSGAELEADIIVTATGLNLVVMGEMNMEVDGQPIDLSKTWTYKGLMTTEVPNLVSTFGYINASWTLRSDITAEWVCRVLNHMDATNTQKVVPVIDAAVASAMPQRPWIDDFDSGYMQRMMHAFPMQGDKQPWLNTQDFKKDKKMFREGALDDGSLSFSSTPPAQVEPTRTAA